MIVVALTPEQRKVAAEILMNEIGVQPCADQQAIFWIGKDGQIEWVVGYTNFLGKTCQMHMVSRNGGYTPRELIKVSFDYPFNQAGCEAVLGVVNSKNEKAMRYDQHLGFTEVTRFPGLHDDGGDIVLFKMDKAQCRWIKERKHED